jgi:hypothetical protein
LCNKLPIVAIIYKRLLWGHNGGFAKPGLAWQALGLARAWGMPQHTPASPFFGPVFKGRLSVLQYLTYLLFFFVII